VLLQITNYNCHKGQITKLQISNFKLLQITNYKSNIICCKFAVWYLYGGMVSCLGQNNHCQLLAFERPFEKRFTLCYRTVVCLSRLSLCNVGVLWPDGWRVPLGKEVRLGPVHVYCGQTAGWIKMPLVMEVGLGPGNTVLDGDPAPPSPKGHVRSPLFDRVYCGQMVAHLSYCWALVN